MGVFLALIGATSCSDAPPPPDGPPPDTQPAKAIHSTSGGGTVQSENFTGQIRIGAPQPMGRADSQNFGVTVGPVRKP